MFRRNLVAVCSGIAVCVLVTVVFASWDTKCSGFCLFTEGRALDAGSSGSNVKILSMRVMRGRKTLLTTTRTSADLEIRNLTVKHLQFTIGIALFDSRKNIVAVGSYSSTCPAELLKPLITRPVKIDMGYAENVKDAKYYQYRIVSFAEESK